MSLWLWLMTDVCATKTHLVLRVGCLMQFISNRSVLCKEVFRTPSVELRVSDKQMSMSPSIAMKKQEVWMSGFQTWKLFCASSWWRAAWELLRPSLKCQLFCQPATFAAHLPTSKSGVSQGPHHPTGSWSPVLQAVGHQSQSLGRQWLTQGTATIN